LHLVVGLGNPGGRYTATRHNVGSQALELAANRWSIVLSPILSPTMMSRTDRDEQIRLGTGRVGTANVTLARSLAWMNQSGPIVKALLEQAELSSSQLVVVHDDLDLDVGRLRIKQRGGSGGHNGLASIIETLQTDEFTRLKIGIGRPGPGEDSAEFVLSPFSPDDHVRITPALPRAVEALEILLREGVAAAMNRYNVREAETEREADTEKNDEA
jgi:peptidyl-tRNA hydrolase, PTH1 family